ncbi:hypothetical protein CLV78_104165 [Aliiruegeria haliotis]|uniref:Avidin family protein n=1 Tax=Aliiruegeria haliotis TaxID=1280846 RepID=A0A2T0RR62_9RHOB|nr:hypothetical protein [Aliiruegeria haliotis]PRY23674.1 hypothetical protein CLV78_104165 [Aliiruegeria haliotis]
MRNLILAVALAATPAISETFEETAKGLGTSANEAMPISDSHVVLKTAGSYEMFEVSDGHPLKGASGPCFGSVEVMGADVSGGGVCVFDTATGDKAVMQWHAGGMGEDGALTGEWTVSGGTGKWTGASGGGTFSSLTDASTGKFVNTIEGAITIE